MISPEKQMAGEKVQAWVAFQYWRDMESPRRITDLVAKMPQPAPSERTLHRWRADFHWDERTAAWDLYRAAVEEGLPEVQIQPVAEEIGPRWWAEHDRKIQELQDFYVKAGNHLAAMGIANLDQVHRMSRDGDLNSKLEKAKISEIASWVQANIKLVEQGLALRERALAVDEICKGVIKA
jgi:hypothetical protein